MELQQLDDGLQSINTLVEKTLNKAVAQRPGSGAAGGTAYGLKAFLDADFSSGTEFILGLTNFFELINTRKIDCIITGEGKIDAQTRNGKLIKGITTIAQRHGIPVLAICGRLDVDASGIKELGLEAAVEIRNTTQPDAYSFEHAGTLIIQKIQHLIKTIL